ncbi:uncharacterized protein LOC134750379 [Cydia strobilella]|uniref:uncharacterized protein LOC134750379 n=1 Tax=Cydia strobilella TaxID=1100964 RepID=UPI003007F04A
MMSDRRVAAYIPGRGAGRDAGAGQGEGLNVFKKQVLQLIQKGYLQHKAPDIGEFRDYRYARYRHTFNRDKAMLPAIGATDGAARRQAAGGRLQAGGGELLNRGHGARPIVMVSAGGRLARLCCARALLLLVCWGALCVLWLPRMRAPPAARPSLSTPATPAALDQLPADTERQLQSLPLAYFYKRRNDTNKFYKTKDCAPLPSVFELEYCNTYWQTLRSSRGVFHLYGAYLDIRSASQIGPAVRLLVVHDRIKTTLLTHCQLWFEEQPDPVIVRVLEYKYVWNSEWGNYCDGVLQPYLLACVLPADVRRLRPAAVSLVEKPCDRATNCLRVHFDEPPDHAQKEFAVCVKGLDFQHEDLSVRLVEWIELVRLLGADKVFFYELQVHPNISKVLAYYRARGIVESTPITLPGGQPNLPGLQHVYMKKRLNNKRQMELVPYNDCLYRHMYQYRWITLLDVDEVIVPMEDPDWSSLLKRQPPGITYYAQNVYYLDELAGREPGAPRYMYMLQHVHRTRNFTNPGSNVKAFHETGRVLALHNHYPLACIGGACSSYSMSTAQVRLHHYRANCARRLSEEKRLSPVRDAALWRWAGRLVPRVARALAALALVPPAEPEHVPTTNTSTSTLT